MEKVKGWEDVLREVYPYTPDGKYIKRECLNVLIRAEQEGKVALNPPDEDELRNIIINFWSASNSGDFASMVAHIISDRIRKG